jgi:glycosyltransferase involved in cell wall biosynthesis
VTAARAEPDSISVVLITRNEERNLPVALRSVVGWTDEVIVVDMESSDRTVDIARDAGARVFTHKPVGFPEPARAYGVSLAQSPWVLVLDADELVTPALAKRIKEIVTRGRLDAVWLPFSNYLFGRRMTGTSWSPQRSRHLRLFRPGFVALTDRIHESTTPTMEARVGSIPYEATACVIHFNYTSIRQFIEKTNRYTDVEALQGRDETSPRPAGRIEMIVRPVGEFLNQWLLKGGYRDGWPGFYIAGLMAFYRFAERAKLRELLEIGDEEAMNRAYAALAEDWLSGHVPD